MVRALYSIEETWARLGGISRSSLYALLRTGDLPSVVIGCRRFVSAEAIATLISSYTTIGETLHGHGGRWLMQARPPSFDLRVNTRSRKSDAE